MNQIEVIARERKQTSLNLQLEYFTDEAFEGLSRLNYIRFFNLNGFSIEELVNLGYPINSGRSIRAGEPFTPYSELEHSRSRTSQVAACPKHILKGSDNKSLVEQIEMLSEVNSILKSHNIIGAKAVIGNAADYAELALQYYLETNQNLVDGRIIRTSTTTDEGDKIAHLSMGRDGAIYLGMSLDRRYPLYYISPLIVPSNSLH
ncbi:hypothetical protein HYT02_01750 [Candidatus Gottesmanbacteria bacterium]|nr:hypothetical protein [Candidatus Gottesmanbacteria bacterium]